MQKYVEGGNEEMGMGGNANAESHSCASLMHRDSERTEPSLGGIIMFCRNAQKDITL